MGVLCNIEGGGWLNKNDTWFYSGMSGLLPDRLSDIISSNHQSQLVVMNDSGKTFNEIADYIEDNILGASSQV